MSKYQTNYWITDSKSHTLEQKYNTTVQYPCLWWTWMALYTQMKANPFELNHYADRNIIIQKQLRKPLLECLIFSVEKNTAF